jgi:hypothetical protein
MHIILRMTIMLSKLVHKDRRWRLNIKVKEMPFTEESRDFKFYKASKNYGTYLLWALISPIIGILSG